MRKKILASILVFTMLSAGTAFADETEVPAGTEVEAVSGASVMDFYGDYGLSGDELMDAINSYSGSYVVSTVNEDGSPQAGFFVYSMVKEGDTYYVCLGLEENQTRENLERTGMAMAVYAANPSAEDNAQFAVSGARMSLKLVTDEALIEKLNTGGYDTTMFCEVEWVRPLG